MVHLPAGSLMHSSLTLRDLEAFHRPSFTHSETVLEAVLLGSSLPKSLSGIGVSLPMSIIRFTPKVLVLARN